MMFASALGNNGSRKPGVLWSKHPRGERMTSVDPQIAVEHIAVVAMAGRFTGDASIEQLWQNLCDGKESIRQYSNDELLAAGVDPGLLSDPHYVKAGTVLEDADKFDASFFGLS